MAEPCQSLKPNDLYLEGRQWAALIQLNINHALVQAYHINNIS